ncbi:hypothetical protein GCM10010123_15920 [Pilimelia anulata]|uniref:Polyketide cyclase n=1 Tax=Pilimelia anulata TaxID=53371 RepID=A0A8J3F8H8_9ACTN|nr:SRPBCC family protein [Pilimelia anulata]GGJ87157.1 hypothetical protein GCM10010123_15920 [Pilimelia anulata]
MLFTARTAIAADPAAVWRVYADVAGWPGWTPTVTAVERLDPGPLRVGCRTRVRQPRLPVAVWEVTELVEGESFTWTARGPGLLTVAAHRVGAAPGGGTAVENALEQRGPLGPLAGRLWRGLTQRYLERELAGLRRHCEAPPPPDSR